MKKSFTLVEMLVSIVIFSIMMVFLYSLISSEQKSKTVIKKELFHLYDANNFKTIIFKDIVMSNCSFKLNKKRNILTIKHSSNTLHNSFYTQIRYIFTKDKLIRVESEPIKITNRFELADVIEASYIDTLLNSIEEFEITVYSLSGGVAFYIKHNSEINLFKVKC